MPNASCGWSNTTLLTVGSYSITSFPSTEPVTVETMDTPVGKAGDGVIAPAESIAIT